MKQFSWFLAVALVSASVFTSCSDDPEPEPVPDPNQVAYDSASISKGGIMYDKFWSTESGFDQNNSNLATLNAKSDFFRCKQCHAWDGLGSNGSYINRAPKTTRPNISAINLYSLAQTKTSKELFDAMKATAGRRDIAYDLSTYDPATNSTEGDKMPNLGQLLTDAQIWDIVKFMKEGMFDVSKLYDATYTGAYPTGKAVFANVGLDGNAANGNTYYTANCKACHGTNGTQIALETLTLGKFVRTKPNEVQHKIHYGQLGSAMVGEFDITLAQMKDLYKACADTVNFPN
ncbi:MAG: c-type cytochrome [Salinivirgaceae bacterium]|jgi:thiosulfate dehydrogenase